MEFDENKDDKIEDKYTDDDYVDIYSKKAIFWFSIFSFIYASVLLIINLWVAGYKRAISQVILFVLFYNILISYVVMMLNIKVDLVQLKKFASGTPITSLSQVLPVIQIFSLTLGFNIIAGFILTRYFFKKYFPDDDYYPKPVLQPIIIYILIALLFGSLGI